MVSTVEALMKITDYKKGHPTDAGIDIPLAEDITIKPGETKRVQLPLEGLSLPTGIMGIPFVRTKFADKILVGSTIIDPLYTGPVHVWITNASYLPASFEKGTAIVQIVFIYFSMRTDISSKTSEPRGYERDTTE